MEKEGGFLYEPLSWSQKLINKTSPFFLEKTEMVELWGD